jgi:hypothetical protein
MTTMTMTTYASMIQFGMIYDRKTADLQLGRLTSAQLVSGCTKRTSV